MVYASFCKRCGVIDRNSEVSQGLLCNACGHFETQVDWALGDPPVGWIKIDIADSDQPDDYVPEQHYCPPCALVLRDRLADYPLPWSKADPARPA
jgi:hypothetical protein